MIFSDRHALLFVRRLTGFEDRGVLVIGKIVDDLSAFIADGFGRQRVESWSAE